MDRRVAYFCLEYAVEANLPLYAGGLGVLAGDVVIEAGEEGMPLIALGLFYSSGVHEPRLSGKSPETLTAELLTAAGFCEVSDQTGEVAKVRVELSDHEVVLQAWEKKYGSARLILLDPDLSENSLKDREICKYLYDGDKMTMLKQEIILGFGGLRLLRLLGLSVDIYHLNEGHTGITLLELLREKVDKDGREPGKGLEEILNDLCCQVVATKHTIFSGAGLHLTSEELAEGLSLFLRKYGFSLEEIFNLGIHYKDPHDFSTTNFLLKFAGKANGVSSSHVYFEKQAHPESRLMAITNGVQVDRWQDQSLGRGDISGSNLWSKHSLIKKNLLARVFELTKVSLNADVLTIVWARRLVAYKRPKLLFNDITRLSQIVNDKASPVQFVIAGRANLAEKELSDIVSTIQEATATLELSGKVVFWSDYDLSIAKILTAGADVWLNTPKVGFEACGTSGMKAGLNGVLQFSVSDGWYGEVDWDGFGWVLPEESANQDIYRIISEEIAPLYYKHDHNGLPNEWIERMEKTAKIVESKYTAKRMLGDYREKLYG